MLDIIVLLGPGLTSLLHPVDSPEPRVGELLSPFFIPNAAIPQDSLPRITDDDVYTMHQLMDLRLLLTC